MTEIANVLNSTGVGIGLLAFILFGVIAIIAYLVSVNKSIAKDTADSLKLKDEERQVERKQYEEDLKDLTAKSNEVYLQVAKSNQNVADALMCLKLSLETMVQKFNAHDDRAIGIDKNVNEVKLRVEGCGKSRK